MNAICEWIDEPGTVGVGDMEAMRLRSASAASAHGAPARVGPTPGFGRYRVQLHFMPRGSSWGYEAAVWEGDTTEVAASQIAEQQLKKWWNPYPGRTPTVPAWWPHGLAFPLPADYCTHARVLVHTSSAGWVEKWSRKLCANEYVMPGAGTQGSMLSGFEWIGAPQNVIGEEQYNAIAAAYADLVQYLNHQIDSLASSYNVTHTQVFDVLKRLNPPGKSHSAPLTALSANDPWCKKRTANPGDPAPNCGSPPMDPSVQQSPCCMDWLPDDCSAAGLVAWPYRPRPICQSTIVKIDPNSGDPQVDIGAYDTGMQVYLDWRKDFDAKLSRVKDELKKLAGTGVRQGGAGSKTDPNTYRQQYQSLPPDAQKEIGSAVRALHTAWMLVSKTPKGACGLAPAMVSRVQKAFGLSVTGEYNDVTAAAVKSIDSSMPVACSTAASGDTDLPMGDGGAPTKSNAVLYVVGAAVVGTIVWIALK